MDATNSDLLRKIASEGKLSDEIDAALDKSVSEFVKGFAA
jgi:hypothetical protein